MFYTDLYRYHFPRITWLVENGKMSELGKMDKAAEHQKSCESGKKPRLSPFRNSLLKQKQSHLGSKTRTEHELSAVSMCSVSDAAFGMKE